MLCVPDVMPACVVLGVLPEGTVQVEHVLMASLVVRRLSPLMGVVTTGVTTRSEEKVNEINAVTSVTTVTTTFGAKRFWHVRW